MLKYFRGTREKVPPREGLLFIEKFEKKKMIKTQPEKAIIT